MQGLEGVVPDLVAFLGNCHAWVATSVRDRSEEVIEVLRERNRLMPFGIVSGVETRILVACALSDGHFSLRAL